MPAGRPMGMGELASQEIRFKRKFRWTFKIQDVCNSNEGIPESFVKLASRPNLTIDETEINFLNGKTWIPGKASWETITVTYYDVATKKNKPLWDWLATVYNFQDNLGLHQGSNRQAYAGKAVLQLYDGSGGVLEEWVLKNVWPQAIQFGDLAYDSSEECTIELTLRYSDVSYNPICPNFKIKPCHEACVPGTQGPSEF